MRICNGCGGAVNVDVGIDVCVAVTGVIKCKVLVDVAVGWGMSVDASAVAILPLSAVWVADKFGVEALVG